MTVDFPDPLSPTRARVLPAGTAREKPSKTVTSGRDGYLKLTSRNSRAPPSGLSVLPWGFGSIRGTRFSVEKMLLTAPSALPMSGTTAADWAMPMDPKVRPMKTMSIELKSIQPLSMKSAPMYSTSPQGASCMNCEYPNASPAFTAVLVPSLAGPFMKCPYLWTTCWRAT